MQLTAQLVVWPRPKGLRVTARGDIHHMQPQTVTEAQQLCLHPMVPRVTARGDIHYMQPQTVTEAEQLCLYPPGPVLQLMETVVSSPRSDQTIIRSSLRRDLLL